MSINRHLWFFVYFTFLHSHPPRKKTQPHCFILHRHIFALLCSWYWLVASLWPAEDSRWIFSGAGFCTGEAPGVGDEVGGQTRRSLGCEVRIAPPGGGLAEDMLSLTTQHWDVSSQTTGRSPGLKSTIGLPPGLWTSLGRGVWCDSTLFLNRALVLEVELLLAG